MGQLWTHTLLPRLPGRCLLTHTAAVAHVYRDFCVLLAYCPLDGHPFVWVAVLTRLSRTPFSLGWQTEMD